MMVKAKDVVRDAPELVAAAPTNSPQPGSPTLGSELVPHAASLAREVSCRVQEFSRQLKK
jgi:hypothetical protein